VVISFRYHVVSIVAVLLALAAGVVLGGGPLRGGATALAGPATDDGRSARLEAQVEGLKAGDRFADDFATAVAPQLVARRLRGHVVTIVALPGARKADVTAIARLVSVAGGRVGGSLQVGTALVDVGEKQLVDELGNQLESQLPRGRGGIRLPATAGTYERMGALVARAIGTDRVGGARVDPAATTVLGALDAAKLMSATGRVTRRGDLVVIVAGAPASGDGSGAGDVVASLATSLDTGTAGVVVAGPVASAAGDGAVKAVRRHERAATQVSTVDALGRSAGQVATVLALAGRSRGVVGQYGTGAGAGSAVPASRD
jgi:hypothetical protein